MLNLRRKKYKNIFREIYISCVFWEYSQNQKTDYDTESN